MSNPEKEHNAGISKPMETLSMEHLESVTGGRDDETQYDVVFPETDIEEYHAICRKGLMDPGKPGELRVCDRCEYLKPFVNDLGFTYHECVYQ